ncbi:ragulator complex protein LAMTOR3-like protein [Globomyces pollinis-pini]|nr:ragulator complex protein LAMTOR3-like protein [Globomyces pollinis-pini]
MTDIRVDNLLAIYVTDRDGVIVIKVCADDMPKKLLEPSFTASFLLANEQLGKAGFGDNKSIICRFSEYDIVQYLYGDFVLTLIGTTGNVEKISIIGRELKDFVELLSKEIHF